MQELDAVLKEQNKYEQILDAGLTVPHDVQNIISKFLCEKMISSWGNK